MKVAELLVTRIIGNFISAVCNLSGTCSTTSCSQSGSVPTAELVSLDTDNEIPPLKPPPLPPRRRVNNRDSTSSSASSDVFIRSGSPEPPLVPPRTDHDQPPPVPPRRDSMYSTNSLNRGQSLSQPRTPTFTSSQNPRFIPPPQSRTQSASQFPIASVQNPVQSATLPRYHGGRDSRFDNTENIFNFNGDSNIDSDIPALPPKTYRQHARKQSS